MISINKYDEYGIPGAGNIGIFQYTGQMWITELGLYYYKARMYSPTLGKFMQTDPVEYEDGMNWYNYVDSDPVNTTDPTGEGGVGATKTQQITLSGVKTLSGTNSQNNTSSIFLGTGPFNSSATFGLSNNSSSSWLSNLPSLGVSGGVSAYSGVGGGASGGVSFDAKTGRLGISISVELGVGVGAGVRGKIVSGSQVNSSAARTNNVSGGVGVSVNGQIGMGSLSISHELVGSSMRDSARNRTQIGVGAGGGGATINANVSAGGGVSIQLYKPKGQK